MRSRLTRIVIPVIGLLAVTAALALVGTAPLVLFPSSKEAGPRPVAPPASSEVGGVTVTAPGQGPSSGEPGASPSRPARGTGSLQSGGAAELPGGPVVPDERGGEVDRSPLSPGAEPGDSKGHKGKNKKEKEHKGKAKGHSKSKAQGKAKGHDKWQGAADVAFAPRGAKPSHLRPSGAGKHGPRSARPHARPRR